MKNEYLIIGLQSLLPKMRDGLVKDDSVLYRELTTIGVFTEKHVIWLVGRGHR